MIELWLGITHHHSLPVDYSSGNIDDFRILDTNDDIHDFEGDLVAMADYDLLDLHLTWEEDEYEIFKPFLMLRSFLHLVI